MNVTSSRTSTGPIVVPTARSMNPSWAASSCASVRWAPVSRPLETRANNSKCAEDAELANCWARTTRVQAAKCTGASEPCRRAAASSASALVGSLVTSLVRTVLTTLFWWTGAMAEHAPSGLSGERVTPANSGGSRRHKAASISTRRRGSMFAGRLNRSSAQRLTRRRGVTDFARALARSSRRLCKSVGDRRSTNCWRAPAGNCDQTRSTGPDASSTSPTLCVRPWRRRTRTCGWRAMSCLRRPRRSMRTPHRTCRRSRMRMVSRAMSRKGWGDKVERATGIEPALSAWEADVLPLNYARVIGGSAVSLAGPQRRTHNRPVPRIPSGDPRHQPWSRRRNLSTAVRPG